MSGQFKSMPGRRAVLIAGSTASGKSALALSLAERLGGVIVNTDSMQVYRDLRIITARPSADEESRAPHRFYGHVDAAMNHSVGHWFRDVQILLAEIAAAGQTPIFVGGTGLYFKALLTGIAGIPPIEPAIRAHFNERLEQEGVEALHAELRRVDPQTAARLMVRDRSRILRALEVLEATGRNMAAWHDDGLPPAIDPGNAIKVFLTPDREQLKKRIAARFDAMLAGGALDEVRALDARKLSETLPAMKAHGVPWLRKFLRGDIAREDAAEGAVMDTRRYAKRQVTWFRNQMPDWLWVKPEQAADAIGEKVARAAM